MTEEFSAAGGRITTAYPFDLARLLQRSIHEHGGDTAVVCGGEARSYAELGDRAYRLRHALAALGVHAGDRVAVLLNNRLEYPEVDVGLAFGGAVRVALNVRLGLEDLSYILDDSGARVLISEQHFDDVAAELASRHGVHWVRMGAGTSPGAAVGYEELLAGSSGRRDLNGSPDARPAWISYTSGTTGRPKGVVLSSRALVNVAFNLMLEMGPISSGRSILLPQPLSHGAGYFVIPYLAAGGTVHVMPRFDPGEALHLGRLHGISTLKCVPTMLTDILDTDEQVPFESIIYGAAPMPMPHIERALDRCGPILMQLYGQSEAPVTITSLQKHDHAKPGPHRGSVGRPWRTVDVQVVDAGGSPVPDGELGEVAVRGGHLMDGYHRRPDLTAEVLRDGWLWTRDMAVRDEAGYIYLRGRRDEMIISGGYNIAPREVEDVVVQHPAVKECVATGVPHERWGEQVQVFVLRNPDVPVDAGELVAFCKPRLGFRTPGSVVFVRTMPRTPYGKVDRVRMLDSAGLDGHDSR